MALTKGRVRREEIPHEPGQWFDLADLGYVTKQNAQEVERNKALARIRNMGGEVFRELREMELEDLEKVRQQGEEQERRQGGIGSYDWQTILVAGIVRWSYPDEVTPENIAELDPETAEWAVRTILRVGESARLPLVSLSPSMPPSTATESHPMNGSYPATVTSFTAPLT